MADEKRNPLGPTGEQVRANVARIREARGMTKKQLADRTAELGRPIPPLGVSRIEAGTRRVDVDDLAALAVALRVSPVTLLLPWTDGPADAVEVTAAGTVQAAVAWFWADGVLPALPSNSDDEKRFILDSRPAWTRDGATLGLRRKQTSQQDPHSGLYEWYVKTETPGAESADG
ncbi:helix-turn-helix domain-containing protein [Streptomyces sp. SS]|uniref:helix-turn-helix domain-containing protein n=1 Tax=Streptomyces sp. SS TaxID=260742 RepID=UPI00035D125B|nr:helix-turn-helix transcriptional regulator [Streptomyces sp. SS]